jgi:hypothetical protein
MKQSNYSDRAPDRSSTTEARSRKDYDDAFPVVGCWIIVATLAALFLLIGTWGGTAI